MQKSYNVYHNLGYWFLLLIVLVFAGFYSSYFTKFFEPTDSLIHFHFAMMSIWVLMLIVQPFFIKYKKLSWHRLVGRLSYIVVPIIVISSFFMIRFSFYTMFSDFRTNNTVEGEGVLMARAADRVTIAVVYFTWFTLFYLLAVVNKRRTPVHARFMLATGITMLGPTLDRILRAEFGILEIFGVSSFIIAFSLIDLILLVLLLKDYRERKPINTLLSALSIYVVGQFIFYTMPGTAVWREFMILIMKPAS